MIWRAWLIHALFYNLEVIDLRQAMKSRNMRLGTDASGHTTDWGFVSKIHRTTDETVAGDSTSVLSLTALTAATQTVTNGITNPPAPRNIQVVGNTAGIVGNVVVTGTSYDGASITETLTLNGTTAVEGTKAFLTVESIELPAFTNANTDEVSVGFGDKLGIPYKLSMDTILMAFVGGVKEGTAPTVTTDISNIENNTVTLNSALNGTEVDLFLVV